MEQIKEDEPQQVKKGYVHLIGLAKGLFYETETGDHTVPAIFERNFVIRWDRGSGPRVPVQCLKYIDKLAKITV
jgi:hypothetical protein